MSGQGNEEAIAPSRQPDLCSGRLLTGSRQRAGGTPRRLPYRRLRTRTKGWVLDAAQCEIARRNSRGLLKRHTGLRHGRIRVAFMRDLIERTSKLSIDGPLDPESHVSSLISCEHMQRFSAQSIGRWPRVHDLLLAGCACARGFFVAPTVFDGCADTMTIAQEEIIGSVMPILNTNTRATL